MKKLMTVVFTMMVASCLAFAQDTGGKKKSATQSAPKTQSKGTNTGKAHEPYIVIEGCKSCPRKGDAKTSKKGASTAPTKTNTTPPPK